MKEDQMLDSWNSEYMKNIRLKMIAGEEIVNCKKCVTAELQGLQSMRTINNKEFELTPPNIGIQKSFTDYIIKENNDSRTPNLAFLKIIPFMLDGRTSITYEGIKAKLKEFEEIDDISFQFLNAAVSKMTFGIKELYKVIDGQEVRADMQFPNGASGIFVVHDAFEAFIKE
jgi:glyoxylate utilization-related uncharacterized protein